MSRKKSTTDRFLETVCKALDKEIVKKL